MHKVRTSSEQAGRRTRWTAYLQDTLSNGRWACVRQEARTYHRVALSCDPSVALDTHTGAWQDWSLSGLALTSLSGALCRIGGRSEKNPVRPILPRRLRLVTIFYARIVLHCRLLLGVFRKWVGVRGPPSRALCLLEQLICVCAGLWVFDIDLFLGNLPEGR